MDIIRLPGELPDDYMHRCDCATITPTRIYITHMARYGNGAKWADISAIIGAADALLIPCYIILPGA